jgi:AmmeMemoRadiSam system protein A
MQKKILLEIAREAIVSKFNHKIIDREKLLKAYPELEEQGAVFVTLKERGNLRGCIGSLIAHRSLLDDIISNAKSAAFGDPRFPPLKERELEQIKIELFLSR